MTIPLAIRDATIDDADGVEAIAARSWPEREDLEYLPRVFPDWLEKSYARTLVAEVTDPDAVPEDAPEIAGIAQIAMLSDDEAWAQGMRVHPAYRGEGVGSRIVEEGFEWAREQGATVARNMVFSWNGAGLGQSRATGFEPATELRFAHPAPDPDADPTEYGPDDAEAVVDPDAAWRYWTHSDAREELSGLAADDEERWAVRELTREDLRRAADGEIGGEPGGAIAIRTGEGTVAMAARTRIDRREPDGDADEADAEDAGAEAADGELRTAVYGATAWNDRETCAALFGAIAADAAEIGADETKVLLPETVGHVSDVAACRVEIHDEPDFVLAADLAGRE